MLQMYRAIQRKMSMQRIYIRMPDVPGGIFNAIYLVNLNSSIIFSAWEIENCQLNIQQRQQQQQ